MDIMIRQWVGRPDAHIAELYRSVGWGSYWEAMDMQKAFACSACVLAVFAEDVLVGLVRAVGDGESVLLIQEILVRPGYRRKGIGTRLLGQVFSRYRHVRQIFVITDDLPHTTAFYKAAGFTLAQQLHYRTFCKLKYR